jgi:hypothetical protein
MGIWLPTLINTTTDASPFLLELAEIQPYARVQTMPLRVKGHWVTDGSAVCHPEHLFFYRVCSAAEETLPSC